MLTKSIRADSPTPIRSQLKALLMQEIQEGRFKRGGRIPSERELAERYGISRASVRESITELINLGILFRTVGRGTFVAAEAAETKAAPAPGSSPLNVGFFINAGIFHFVQTGYNRILGGVQEICASSGWRLVFHAVGEDKDSPLLETIRASQSGFLDGCIVVGGVGRHVLDALDEQGIPTVLVDPLINDESAPADVTIDYASGARLAIRHLYDLGHRAIGYVGFAGNEKYKAYWQSLEELELRYDPRHVEFLQVLDIQPGILAGYQAIQRILASGRLPSALLVTNDLVAIGATEGLMMAGVRVPDQISVIGFDDLGQKTSPPLTTVRADLARVGRLAADAMLRKLQRPRTQIEHMVVPVELVVRATTAPVRCETAAAPSD
jgi:DNA-binding LacI/PurR family transcriptional regulator